MFFGKRIDAFHTVTFRLTAWYAATFAVSAAMVFGAVYFTLKSNMRRRVDAELLTEVREMSELFRSKGIEAVRTDFERETRSSDAGGVFDRILSADGRELFTSDADAWQGVHFDRALPARVSAGEPALETLKPHGRGHRIRTVSQSLGNGKILQVGQPLPDDDEILEDYRENAGLMIASVVAAALVGWFMAHRAMSGVGKVTQAAIRISAGDLSQRVPLGKKGDEIDQLATAFNTMVARLQVLVTELKEVTNNIAHDLRSPITRMRGLAEAALSRHEHSNDSPELAANVVEECDRLIGIINTMLEIAEAESGVAQFARAPVDFDAIVRDACDLFQPVAEDKGVHLRKASPDVPAMVRGDALRLQRVVANLLDNALKYTPTGGSVVLTVAETSTEVVASVADTGGGIEEKDLPHIFERFYRGDPSRSTPGNGLGLSLAQAFVRAHGGEIHVQSTVAKGTVFTVHLPAERGRGQPECH